MKSNVKLDLILEANKELDRQAYQKLKEVSAGQRKQLLLSFVSQSQKKDLVFLLLRGFALAVSGLLVLLSIHFTYEFNALVMPVFWALLLSLALVVFTSFALTFASYCSKTSKTLFTILWIIGISYSIFTAFAGQYNSFRQYSSTEASLSSSSSVLDLLKEEEVQLQSRLESLKESQAPYATLIADLSSTPEKKVEYPQTWRDANTRFDRIQSQINSVQTQLEQNHQEQKKLLSQSSEVVENKTVYTWLAELLHVSAKLLEFLILVLPSCFIDLASSLLLKFALGKRKII